MKKLINYLLVFSLLFFTLTANAQNEKTIDFKDVPFKEAQELAKASGKLIFIDCYTSWCMPCKKMEKTVFTVDSVYEFYNANFINYKSDMEKGEGIELRKKYEVKSFPTYLFVNADGVLVHRAASLMPVNEFLKEGETALHPKDSYTAWQKRYENGERTNDLLFKYGNAVRNVNREQADKIKQELSNQISDKELLTSFGWEVIETNSNLENDKLGTFLLANQKFYENLVGKPKVQTVINRLKMSSMYSLIRNKEAAKFFERIKLMKEDNDMITQRNIVMLETEYYLETNNVDSFIAVSKRAMNGVLATNDADLSFIARRAERSANGNKEILKQSLVLARKAVVINPEEYSNQGTLASICLELKLKDEGVAAAKKARSLADEFTSKIQNIAQALLDKLEALK